MFFNPFLPGILMVPGIFSGVTTMPTRTPMNKAQQKAFERHMDAATATPEEASTAEVDDTLDQSIADLIIEINEIDDVDRLRELLAAEHGGKTRKGAIEAIEAAIAARTEE
jgi:hypothetical protein